ncbi:nitroimidazol reductase NimA-like FMN-containing flavoprotein (pyridoxamine 5'-phosphate oxidase superfamily) [Rhodococcus sp. 27YEA15]|uniref:pyridoxamine 5'-phosphate oxidase family protein n=1 Tax=Rhodococcus sp. 27YEA15 TaxID=3156259 RepID=UPI003C7D8A49
MHYDTTSDDTLSPTPRTTLNRSRNRAVTDRSALAAILESAKLCHFGVVVDGTPLVMPTAFGVDLSGPDRAGTLYLHGSVAARSLTTGGEICVTVTHLDGLVLARSAFHHSMNYRSAVILGTPRVVSDPAERLTALDLIVDQIVPGRSAQLRHHTRKELAATTVVALSLFEASVKVRSGDPVDDQQDVQNETVWAGVIPACTQFGTPVPAKDLTPGNQVPDHVRNVSESTGRQVRTAAD